MRCDTVGIHSRGIDVNTFPIQRRFVAVELSENQEWIDTFIVIQKLCLNIAVTSAHKVRSRRYRRRTHGPS